MKNWTNKNIIASKQRQKKNGTTVCSFFYSISTTEGINIPYDNRDNEVDFILFAIVFFHLMTKKIFSKISHERILV